MVEIMLTYSGALQTIGVHVPTGSKLATDAPVDNHGKGTNFAPSDLLATALGACMLTSIGLAAQRQEWDVVGTRIRVRKEMVADPLRRIGRLHVDIFFSRQFDQKELKIITNAVTTSPVRLSINDRIDVPIHFIQPE